MDTSKAYIDIQCSIRNLRQLTKEQKLCIPHLSSTEKDNIILLYNDIFNILVETLDDTCSLEAKT